MSGFVYILKGDRFYVGSTTDVQRRICEHKRGHTHTTKRIGNWDLVRVIETKTLEEARALEKKIKSSKNISRWIEQPRT